MKTFVISIMVFSLVSTLTVASQGAQSTAEKKELENAVAEIDGIAKKSGLKETKRTTAVLQEGVEKGLPVKFAKDVVSACIGQGLKEEEIEKNAREVWKTALKDKDKTDFETLGSQVKELLKKGLRGEALANAIHEKIAARHAAKKAEVEKKVETKKEAHGKGSK